MDENTPDFNWKIFQDFNWKMYIEVNEDLKHMNKSQAKKHFYNVGIRENRKYKYKNIPNDFNPKEYIELNEDLKHMTEIEAKVHYENDGHKENRKYKYENIPDDFNPKEYIELNEDLKHMTEIEAKVHYENDGHKENRKYKYENIPDDFNPKEYIELNESFKVKEYIELNDDLKQMTEIEAKEHFKNHGHKENRKFKYENIPEDFNPKEYIELNEDLKHMTEIEAKLHYENDGHKENREYKINNKIDYNDITIDCADIAIDCRLIHRNITGVEQIIIYQANELIKLLENKSTIINILVYNNINVDKINITDKCVFHFNNHTNIIKNSTYFFKCFQCSDINQDIEFLNASKSIYMYHDCITMLYPSYSKSNKEYSNYCNYFSKSLEIANKLIHISSYNAFELDNLRIKNDNTYVLNHSLDYFIDKINKFNINQIKTDIIKACKQKYFFINCSFLKHKNIKMIFNAFDELNIPDLYLYCSGRYDFKNIENNRNIQYFDYINDNELIYFMYNSIANIYPSLYEGFGLVPIENYILGKPVIKTNSTALLDIDYNNQFVFNGFECESCKDIIKYMYCNIDLLCNYKQMLHINATKFIQNDYCEKLYNIITDVDNKKTKNKIYIPNYNFNTKNTTKKILFVCWQDIRETASGNIQRITQMLKYLKKQNYSIHFLSTNVFYDNNFINETTFIDKFYTLKNYIKDINIENLFYKFYDNEIIETKNIEKNFCCDNAVKLGMYLNKYNNYDILWCEYIWTSRIMEYVHGPYKIIDTHDSFYSQSQFKKYNLKSDLFINFKTEQKLLSRCNLSIAITYDDYILFKRMRPSCDIVTCGMYNFSENEKKDYVSHDMSSINSNKNIFIIASNNILNTKCVNEFIVNVWEKNINLIKCNKYILHIIGNVCDNIINKNIENIIFHGMLDDNQCKPIIEKCLFSINPVYIGSGLKIKSLYAIFNNKILISFQEGVRGLKNTGFEYFKCCETDGDWDGYNKLFFNTMQEDHTNILNSINIVQKYYSEEYVYDNLTNKIFFDINISKQYKCKYSKIAIIFVCYNNIHKFVKFRKYIEVKFQTCMYDIYIVNNNINQKFNIDLFENEFYIQGSNLLFDFSGYDEGIKYIKTNKLDNYDYFLFSNDTFEDHYNLYLNYFDESYLQTLDKNFILGHIDERDIYINENDEGNFWVRTCFFILSRDVLDKLVNITLYDNIDNVNNNCITNKFQKYLYDLIKTYEKNHVINDIISLKKKTAIINETYLTIRCKNAHINIFDLYYLFTQQKFIEVSYKHPLEQIKFRKNIFNNLNFLEKIELSLKQKIKRILK
jgi:hypothetical protein